jgi:CDP-diglyceride synthetase
LDSSVKNLREWVVLLFCLFCVLDIAGVQYGMMLAQDAPLQPNPVVGQIVSIVRGPRGAWYNVYVTEQQLWIFHALLAGAALSLFATLGLIVAHGMRRVHATRVAADLRHRKR